MPLNDATNIVTTIFTYSDNSHGQIPSHLASVRLSATHAPKLAEFLRRIHYSQKCLLYCLWVTTATPRQESTQLFLPFIVMILQKHSFIIK